MIKNLYPGFSLLLVDDEVPWLKSISRSLKSLGGFNNLLLCSDSREVMPLLAKKDVGLVLLDLTMPYVSGENLLQRIKDEHPEVLIIILSGMNQVETAVNCMQLGAYDYFVKSVEEERLIEGVRRAVQLVELQRENHILRQHFLNVKLNQPEVFAPLITRNKAMYAIFRYLESVAASNQPILVMGESGVGKELIVQAIHQLSGIDGKLVSVNVAGLDDNMFSDTLFGHISGAFTGAAQDRAGMIEQAVGGTLFLDEIGDLSIASQVKLLRLLQEGEYFPLGSDRHRKLQARILCATNQNLDARVADKSFRKDLFFRLQTHQVSIPSLKERRGDLPFLLEHFLQQAAKELGKKKPTVPKELVSLLATYNFPGNIRELRAMVFDAVSVHQRGVLSMVAFKQRIKQKETPLLEVKQTISNPFLSLGDLPTLREAGALLVDAALKRADGNQTIAANLLGITQPSLSKRLKLCRAIKHKNHNPG